MDGNSIFLFKVLEDGHVEILNHEGFRRFVKNNIIDHIDLISAICCHALGIIFQNPVFDLLVTFALFLMVDQHLQIVLPLDEFVHIFY